MHESTSDNTAFETMRDMAIRGKSDKNGELITYKTLEQLFERQALFKALSIGEDNR